MQESANRTPCPFLSDCPESCALQEHRDGDPQAGRGLVAIGSPLRRASARRRTPTLSERLAARPTQATAAPQMAEDISLIALAAWLQGRSALLRVQSPLPHACAPSRARFAGHRRHGLQSERCPRHRDRSRSQLPAATCLEVCDTVEGPRDLRHTSAHRNCRRSGGRSQETGALAPPPERYRSSLQMMVMR